ncbi:hypothetical protein B0H15DRAFT_773521 [Mycena belliarum]|uniref:BTB domain-containing protein n=1 Tax=Mycena belliarum TaxID=1033014 RepID=A0AAD6UDS6_9AGAR|nr:hypothetical protein B0H15DRAFT_773521 [Mycena belliae]
MDLELRTTPWRRQREEDAEDAEDGPARSRPRLEDATLVEDDVDPLVRDGDYYRADGDCILRVEDTLFKIHRHLLCRGSSAFEGLFALPSDADALLEGKDDALPITLYGDKVSEIRAFLGYAYSSPLDLQYPRIPSGDIYSLIGTAKFAHKYRLESFETWALDAISYVCSKRNSALLRTCAPELYFALLDLDLLCPLASVKKSIRAYWVQRLHTNTPGITLAFALETADRFRFRPLQGDVYYLLLQTLRDTPPGATNLMDAAPLLPSELSDVHKLRLLMGFRSLSLAWGRVYAEPIALLKTDCTAHASVHEDVWAEQWRQAQAACPVPQGGNFVRLLLTFQSSLHRNFALVPNPHNYPCILATLNQQFPALIKSLRNTMADHFLGTEVAEP